MKLEILFAWSVLLAAFAAGHCADGSSPTLFAGFPQVGATSGSPSLPPASPSTPASGTFLDGPPVQRGQRDPLAWLGDASSPLAQLQTQLSRAQSVVNTAAFAIYRLQRLQEGLDRKLELFLSSRLAYRAASDSALGLTRASKARLVTSLGGIGAVRGDPQALRQFWQLCKQEEELETYRKQADLAFDRYISETTLAREALARLQLLLETSPNPGLDLPQVPQVLLLDLPLTATEPAAPFDTKEACRYLDEFESASGATPRAQLQENDGPPAQPAGPTPDVPPRRPAREETP